MATSTTATRTTVIVRSHGQKPYFKTVHGIIRISEIILSILTFICCAAGYCSFASQAGWGAFVSFVAFIGAVLFMMIRLFGAYDAYPKVPLVFIELVFYSIWTAFYLIASCVLISLSYYSHCVAGAAAGAFFGFCATILFAIDTALIFREWLMRRDQTIQTTTEIET